VLRILRLAHRTYLKTPITRMALRPSENKTAV